MSPGILRAAVVSAALFLPAIAGTTSVDINPVRIDLAGQGQPAELRLTNNGDTELALQVDVMQWRQDDAGSDRLVETDQLLAVPPLFTIPPGEQQIVRIGYLGLPNPDLEQSFRLLVTELAEPSGDEQRASSLAMRMRFSIPAFVAPTVAPAEPEIVMQSVEADENGTRISISNAGNAHARLKDLEVRRPGGWDPLPDSISIRYLLPGATAIIELPPDEVFSAVRIGSTDGRDWEYVVRSPF